jgi:hypothetical protein
MTIWCELQASQAKTVSLPACRLSATRCSDAVLLWLVDKVARSLAGRQVAKQTRTAPKGSSLFHKQPYRKPSSRIAIDGISAGEIAVDSITDNGCCRLVRFFLLLAWPAWRGRRRREQGWNGSGFSEDVKKQGGPFMDPSRFAARHDGVSCQMTRWSAGIAVIALARRSQAVRKGKQDPWI